MINYKAHAIALADRIEDIFAQGWPNRRDRHEAIWRKIYHDLNMLARASDPPRASAGPGTAQGAEALPHTGRPVATTLSPGHEVAMVNFIRNLDNPDWRLWLQFADFLDDLRLRHFPEMTFDENMTIDVLKAQLVKEIRSISPPSDTIGDERPEKENEIRGVHRYLPTIAGGAEVCAYCGKRRNDHVDVAQNHRNETVTMAGEQRNDDVTLPPDDPDFAEVEACRNGYLSSAATPGYCVYCGLDEAAHAPLPPVEPAPKHAVDIAELDRQLYVPGEPPLEQYWTVDMPSVDRLIEHARDLFWLGEVRVSANMAGTAAEILFKPDPTREHSQMDARFSVNKDMKPAWRTTRHALAEVLDAAGFFRKVRPGDLGPGEQPPQARG